MTEDFVRYIAFAGEQGVDFLARDPVWAQDFAPNGELMSVERAPNDCPLDFE